jgi:hypothetical protein
MCPRYLIAAALMTTTFAAQADVIAVSSASPLAPDMQIADSLSSLNAADQFYLVRGVEGLYMVASRTISQQPDAVVPTLPDTAQDIIPGTNAGDATPLTPVLSGTTPPLSADAGPVVNASEVPEPTSIALLLAGVLGAAGFTRARKQG